MMFIYHILDIFFIVFHTAYTLFSTLGWIWKKTRKANLVLLLLTGFSWIILGLTCGLGLGYCPLTDWHWSVRMKIGYTDIPRSYIKFLADLLTGMDFDAGLVDTVVAVVFAAAIILSVTLNVRDFIKKQQVKKSV